MVGREVHRTELPFVDAGNAPEFFANRLYDVQVMGSVVRFIPVTERWNHQRGYLEPPFTCVMPIDAVGPAIGLVLRIVPGLIIPGLRIAGDVLGMH